MALQEAAVVRYWCTLNGARINYRESSRDLADLLLLAVSKRVGEEGITLQSVNAPEQATMHILFMVIEQGSQLLRWLWPAVGRASIEIEMTLTDAGKDSKKTRYQEDAASIFCGGTASGLLRACAKRIARRVSIDLLGWLS